MQSLTSEYSIFGALTSFLRNIGPLGSSPITDTREEAL